MVRVVVYNVVFLFYLCRIIFGSTTSLNHETTIDSKVLTVGEELKQETLPLQLGSRLYQLHGLKSSRWYEVKISYPASIPASFSIQLKRHKFYKGFNGSRRLLNTEKLIFEADGDELSSVESSIYALVAVEPAGVVALPHVQERQFVSFNIVCDELLYGIPHKAWWVGILVLLCLGLALVLPHFLPSNLLQKNQRLIPGFQPHKTT
ncbi:hypothetical protein GIB67_002463 [Kingdonia uniflora]|uniref:Uncharacterized protein n=1 Tax=Kingdonia uniflora TaxID=39325 RepID=A0A7J7LAS6_9MAGN|nr:hypothetical protein GIB67_002463 [Kingdonia uniflora]